MNSMTETVKDVRETLKQMKYDVISCTQGTGSAGSWITVRVLAPESLQCYDTAEDGHQIYSEDFRAYERDLYMVVKVASGREDRHDDISSDYFCEKISADVIPRDVYEREKQWKADQKARQIKHKTCPQCGKIVTKYTRMGYRWYRKCPDCGTGWSHGCA